MKDVYKHIVEAIKHGVNLALDDFEEDDINLPSSKTNIIKNIKTNEYYYSSVIAPKIYKLTNLKVFYEILHTSNKQDWIKNAEYYMSHFDSDVISDEDKAFLIEYIKEHYDFHREYVNLNLPSGTLWVTENLGIASGLNKTFAAGIEKPLDNGSWFIWGIGKENPTDVQNLFTLGDDYVSQLRNQKQKEVYLNEKDDGAYIENPHYRTPSINDFDELVNNTMLIKLYKNQGCAFISKKDPLNFLFFPKEDTAFYLTSNLTMRKNTFTNKQERNVTFIRLYKQNEFQYDHVIYKIWDENEMPSILAHIRPIYIK